MLPDTDYDRLNLMTRAFVFGFASREVWKGELLDGLGWENFRDAYEISAYSLGHKPCPAITLPK